MLEMAARVPACVWGRDQLGTGEMWNSNSVISWVLARGGLPAAEIQPPEGGRGAWMGSGRRRRGLSLIDAQRHGGSASRLCRKAIPVVSECVQV